MPVGNFLVGGVLRSPMHRVMSQSLLLLTFQGHRTGKEYTFPVAYTRFGSDELVAAMITSAFWEWMNSGTFPGI